MRFNIAILLFLFAASAAFGQDVFKGEHYIEVTGSAETEVEPNEIFLFIKLREFEENRSKYRSRNWTNSFWTL